LLPFSCFSGFVDPYALIHCQLLTFLLAALRDRWADVKSTSKQGFVRTTLSIAEFVQFVEFSYLNLFDFGPVSALPVR
jgi:hypothetical protein